MRTIALLLLPSLILGVTTFHVGFSGGRPTLGLGFFLPVDLGEVRAVGDGAILLDLSSGYLRPSNSKVVEMVDVELGTVALSVSPHLLDLPPGSPLPKAGSTILKVWRSWLVFEDGVSLWVDTGYVGVYIGRENYRVIFKPFGWIGMGYDGVHGLVMILNSDLGWMVIGGDYLGLRFRAPGLGVSVSVEDRPRIEVGYFGRDEYLVVDGSGVEFRKKVGSVYAVGRFNEKGSELSVEFPIRF